ncbi:MAG: hypothetical protein CL674_04820 [Bdellovibrionaceae bacterium]|nr:hypothetical protein [Pseudobdellovibrionaceae bacterium]|tara:strand:- start:72026 stop:72436 length:411 start_codon:yes stop_codon:yes gene_type:complete
MQFLKSSIAVDEYVSPIDHFVSADTNLHDIYKLMEENSWRHIPITENNKPIGILSARDIYLLKSFPKAMDLIARDVMIKNPYTVESGFAIEDVALEMSKRKIGSALVVNTEGELEGIFTSTDALNALIEVVRGETK